MSNIRRVVTGLDAEDRAVVQFDSQLALEPGPFGINSVNLWITDSYPAGFSFAHDTVPRPIGISPPDNGTKFRIVEFPPLDQATEAKMPPGLLHALVGDQAPKRGRAVSHPLMHRTRSVDYAIVLSGIFNLCEIDPLLLLCASLAIRFRFAIWPPASSTGLPRRSFFGLVAAFLVSVPAASAPPIPLCISAS
jgi:hypothetical protein